jgi:hypothetical protein
MGRPSASETPKDRFLAELNLKLSDRRHEE